MKFRKKEEPTKPYEIPYYRPQILVQTKNYRIVKKQTISMKNIGPIFTQVASIDLVLEVKDKNAMEEPYWITSYTELKKTPKEEARLFKDSQSEELWAFIREVLNP